MVMEMMSYNLTSFVNNHQDIPVHIKYSIVHDVSLGLRYLHNYDPPIVHQNLFPNNILLTGCFVAKISDIALANGILDEYLPYSSSDYTIDFIAPEVFSGDPISTPMDVFSFAGIILYVFSQKWPRVSIQKKFNCHAVTLSEAEKRLEHLEKMETEFTMVKPLVVECLNDDPAARPTMEIVSERIQRDKNKCATQTPYDGTTFNIPLKQTRNVARLQQNLIIKDAPPLIPSLLSGAYTLKWTRLADLPVPMNFANVAAKDDKIFVTASSSFDNTFHHLYVYDVNKDDWHTLPPSGHWDGIPHIIGDKLAIIGGYLSSTNKVTNEVSTFNEDNQTWISCYPDMLLARRQPGVVSYLEHVIVLGGKKDETYITRDDIEILNWRENIQWKRVLLKLPVPMWGFTPSTCDDQLIIVGHHDEVHRYNVPFMISFTDIISSVDHEDTSVNFVWVKLTPTHPYWSITVLPNSSPPVIVGGRDRSGKESTDCIKMYDSSYNSWKTIATLPSRRGRVAVATISNNSIIVIGGIAQMGGQDTSKAYNLTLVELGQAELSKLRKPSIIEF
ncbi:uncharacterized protein [Dysidea avara]